MWRIISLLSILPLVHSSCPYGFQLVQNECRGNYSRIYTTGEDSGFEAKSLCQGILGQPIIIHNDEQQSYWRSHISSSVYTVIGLKCNCSSKKWEWEDGSALDYKPDNISQLDLDCTTVYNGQLSWMMNSNGLWAYYEPTHQWTTDIWCTVPLRQPVPSNDGCESFEDDSDDGICYQVGATAENWQDAQIICRRFGANVASIHNEKENSFVRRLAVSKGAVNGMFLGASLTGKGNKFGWLDGSEWDYDNFYPGFPMTGLGDCLLLDTGDTSGHWTNVDCSSKLPVACEREQHFTPPACSPGPWKEGQIIFSPGFPFDASAPCDFILSVDEGKLIEVEILILEANPCCDSLVIYENYFGSNIIANLTGLISDEKYKTTSSNYMKVSWRPNGGVNVKGMLMTYRSF